jgi:nucleoside-diphosphate-sugar epimerase
VTDPVVIFGGGSYVGSWLVRDLLGRGHRVIAVSRRPATARALLTADSDALTIADPEDAGGLIEGGGARIVNLADAGELPAEEVYQQNRRTQARWERQLARSIDEIGRRGCRQLVHVSTSAVFGRTFSEPPAPARIRWRPMDDSVAESQLRMEHQVERVARQLGCELAIVRLGNVIGPGSATWVAGLAQRILEVKPVGYEGAEGFSNATLVENVADYVGHLIGQPPGALREFGTYHHLAEFSSHRWPELLEVIAREVGYRWTTTARPAVAPSRGRPLRRAVQAAYRSAPGVYVRAGVALLPEWGFLDRLPAGASGARSPGIATDRGVGAEDVDILEALSERFEFRSFTLQDWRPRLDFSAACAEIGDWVRRSGYSLHDR